MKRNWLVVMVCALFLGLGQAQDVREVTFWTGHGEPDLSALQQIVDDFNAENPDINVTLVQIPPGDVTDVTRLMTAVRGGTGPDVYMLDRFIVAQRAADGLLQDLTPYMGGEDVLAEYIEFARNEAMFGGLPYALPFDTDARALFYNIDMMEEAGVDVSELDPANGPITLERAKEIGAMLDQKNAQGNFERMGFIPWHEQGWHYGFGFSFGGDFYDEAACQVTPTDENIVRAFQWIYDYAAEKGPQQVQAFRQAFTRPDLPPQQNPFIAGQLGMMITGDWMIANMARYAPDMNYGITYMPTTEEGGESVTWAGGWSMVMPQGAKEPEAAFEFMRYIAGEPGQTVYTRETQHMPTITSLLDNAELYDERHQFFGELLPTAQSRPPLPVGALYWDELTDAWERTYLNQQEPQAALEQVASRVQPQLEPFCAQLQAEN
jgi:multiple sugar transport system substrate-binding protein